MHAATGIQIEEFCHRLNSPITLLHEQYAMSQPFTESSRRTPQYSTNLNNADNIERYLQEDGHRTWGFVIYRCTYDSDDDWNKFMEHLRHHIRQALEVYNGLDMMDSLSLTVIEDRSILDDASTSFVREHFKQWAATAPEQEQGEGIGPGLSQRYRYCIQVDDAALESIIEDKNDGFIN